MIDLTTYSTVLRDFYRNIKTQGEDKEQSILLKLWLVKEKKKGRRGIMYSHMFKLLEV